MVYYNKITDFLLKKWKNGQSAMKQKCLHPYRGHLSRKKMIIIRNMHSEVLQ